MSQTSRTIILLISFLALSLPWVSAAGNSAGSAEAFTSQDMPDLSSCETPTGTTLDPECPFWDGEHAKPDPFLVYDFSRKSEESEYGLSSLQPPRAGVDCPRRVR